MRFCRRLCVKNVQNDVVKIENNLEEPLIKQFLCCHTQDPPIMKLIIKILPIHPRHEIIQYMQR
jgi:hypothetical protein